jgi:CRP-like cAMP-binding protein
LFACSSFGELAILCGVPRAATVVCSQPGRLWTISCGNFLTAVSKTSLQQLQPMAQKQLDAYKLKVWLHAWRNIIVDTH